MAWTLQEGLDLNVSVGSFARICTELNVKRVRHNGTSYYALLPALEAPAARERLVA